MCKCRTLEIAKVIGGCIYGGKPFAFEVRERMLRMLKEITALI